jgi:hypothetical protein
VAVEGWLGEPEDRIAASEFTLYLPQLSLQRLAFGIFFLYTLSLIDPEPHVAGNALGEAGEL